MARNDEVENLGDDREVVNDSVDDEVEPQITIQNELNSIPPHTIHPF